MRQKQPGHVDRTTRLLQRVDTYLPRLPGMRARRLFLEAQIAAWEQRYTRFVATEGSSEPALDPSDPPTAADFLMTLVELARRRGALPKAGGKMISHPPREALKRAMLSLLVVADERCPAIIGRAHVLYYSGGDGATSQVEEMLVELRRDVQELLQALIGAEAVVKSIPKPSNR